MNLFKGSPEDLENVRSQARAIDEGMNFLESKLTHVKNLGLSLDPEKTKMGAENILKEHEEELKETKTNVMAYMKFVATISEDCKNWNEQLAALISETQSELQEFEAIMRTKESYQPFEPTNETVDSSELQADIEPCNTSTEQVSLMQSYVSTDRTVTPDNKPSYSSVLGSSCKKLLLNMSMPKEAFLSPSSADIKSSKTRCSETSNRSISDCHLNNSIGILEKKLNRTEEVMRTPVDPGVSFITMKLLGKSNVKTKVYKKAACYNLKSDKENDN